MSVFGLPLSKVVAQGQELPAILENAFTIITRALPFPNLFVVQYSDPVVQELKLVIDRYQGVGDNPLFAASPHYVAGLVVLFFRMLPTPVIPYKYYPNFVRVSRFARQLTRLQQLRVFFAKMPQPAKSVALRLFSFLKICGTPPNECANLFAKYIARPSTDVQLSMPSDNDVTRSVAECVLHADYISLAVDAPSSRINDMGTDNQMDTKMEAIVRFDFDATDANMLSLRTNQHVTLINAFPDDWLEGTLNGRTAFLPSGYVELVAEPEKPISNIANKPAGFGVPQSNPNPPGGFGGNNPTGFGAKPSGFGGSVQPGIGGNNPNQNPNPSPSGFGGNPPSGLGGTYERPMANNQPFNMFSNPNGPSYMNKANPINPNPNPFAGGATTGGFGPQSGMGTNMSKPGGFGPMNTGTYATPPPQIISSSPVIPSNPNPNTNTYGMPGRGFGTNTMMNTGTNPRPTSNPTTGMGMNTNTNTYGMPPMRPSAVDTPNRGSFPATGPAYGGNSMPITTPSTSKPQQSGQTTGSATISAGTNEHKIAVVGAGGVGKSAITIAFVQNHFIEEYDPTIEDSYRKQITVDEVTCFLSILDTAGQEEYSAMRDQYMRNGQGFLLVFSLTARNTFEEIAMMRSHILQVKDVDQIPILLAANKWDLHSEHLVTKEEVQELAARFKLPWHPTSAKDHLNVDECFHDLVREIRRTPGPTKPTVQKKGGCSLL